MTIFNRWRFLYKHWKSWRHIMEISATILSYIRDNSKFRRKKYYYYYYYFSYYRCFLAHNFCKMETANQCKNETVLNYYKESQSFDMMSANGSVWNSESWIILMRSLQYCPACICEMDGSDSSYLDAESQIIAWFILIIFGVGTFLGSFKLVRHNIIKFQCYACTVCSTNTPWSRGNMSKLTKA